MSAIELNIAWKELAGLYRQLFLYPLGSAED
jgi:hypothetical protein